jgi:arsenate reductase
MAMASTVIIYHNPRCGTSRNTLAMIRNAGLEPQVIEYLHTPPSQDTLRSLVAAMGVSARDLLRAKEPLCQELRMDDPALGDDALSAAMADHPLLINRPVVVTPQGTRLCRPSELVLDILPAPQQDPFTKEDGEVVIDQEGRRRV